jgi:hypothetical protein
MRENDEAWPDRGVAGVVASVTRIAFVDFKSEDGDPIYVMLGRNRAEADHAREGVQLDAIVWRPRR